MIRQEGQHQLHAPGMGMNKYTTRFRFQVLGLGFRVTGQYSQAKNPSLGFGFRPQTQDPKNGGTPLQTIPATCLESGSKDGGTPTPNPKS